MKETTSTESLQIFGNLVRSTLAEGTLNEKTKELITYSLVILSKCKECIEVHHFKALKMGISEEELKEAAWCAIAMGGAPVKMFYSSFMDSLTKE